MPKECRNKEKGDTDRQNLQGFHRTSKTSLVNYWDQK